MLYQEIMDNYIDGNGLVTPGPYTPGGNGQGSDNGPMFLAEFYVMLKRSGISVDVLFEDFLDRILPCIDSQGNLRRVPDPTPEGQSNRQQGPDDYLAVLNASKELHITSVPRTFLKALFKNFGSLNNESPGKWSWRSFLIRQPQLLAAIITTSFPNYNPLHLAIRGLAFPLYLYSAIIIATSCRGKDISDTDSRRLSWHLVQILKNKSLLCWLASKLWYKRLYRDYGPMGMKAVATIYYHPHGEHPFSKYWMD